MNDDRLFLSSFVLFVFKTLVFITFLFLPIYFKGLGLTGWEIGFLMGLTSLTTIFITIPTGISNDLFISRNLVALSFMVLFLVYLLIGSAAIFSVLVLIFIVLGASTGVSQISIKALIYKTAGSRQKGKRFSIVTFSEHAGVALGSAIGGILLLSLSYNTLFKITGVLFFVFTPLLFYLPRAKTHLFDLASYRKQIFRKEVVFFSAITFLYAYHWGTEKAVYTLFLKENLGMTQMQIGVFIGITVGILALAALLFGKLLDTKIASMKKLIVFGLLVASVGHILFALSTTTTYAYIFRILHEIGDASYLVFAYVMVSNLFIKSRIGGGSGVISQMIIFGGFAGSFLTGILLQHFGNRVPMIIAGVLTLAALYFIKDIKLKN